MKTSKEGIEFIKKWEGFSKTPYLCPAGKPTIGYGSTYYPNGEKVTLNDKPITEKRAVELLTKSLIGYENIVNNRIYQPLTQRQFDALVSHTYNTGGSDNLFKKINDNDPSYADWWLNHYIIANGKEQKGLINRRSEELEMFQNI